ncbi:MULTISPECIES: hypothetical protein [Microbacterium]|uniref:hypothetical protein n=1 Tax=Microbacterium TaxID=33882 RepID=UPI00217E9949|nr:MULTISPECIES: hypothetical protein [Microbacterium]UWF77452.1 hypothetical protein JSY13_11965 [Microbacterium neungamense]WCM55615.1 hypothetical protein JRG78_11975 [Microbacterium sp. EF45047]
MSRSGRERLLAFGFAADGVFKLAVAVALTVLIAPASTLLHADPPLALLTALVIAGSGIVEIGFAMRAARLRGHSRFLATYDAGLVIASLAAWWLAGEDRGGLVGAVWLGYQLAASTVLAALLLRKLRSAARDLG